MKKGLLSLLLITSFLYSGNSFALLVGKVDIQKILLSVKEGKSVRSRLKGEFEKKQKELKKEEAKIKKLQDNLQKQDKVLSDKAKEKKRREIQERFVKLQQKSIKYQKDLQAKENRFKKPILKKVDAIIKSVSKRKGVDVTFEISTTPLIYAKKSVDLTSAVIKAYDKKKKKKK